jgi:hypothetical protein
VHALDGVVTYYCAPAGRPLAAHHALLITVTVSTHQELLLIIYILALLQQSTKSFLTVYMRAQHVSW